MNKFIQWGCTAAWSVANTLPVLANTEVPIQQYPGVEVQNTPLEYRQFEKVEITGSSIVRKQQTQALPVQIYTREDLLRSGIRSTAEIVQKLPIMGQAIELGQLTQVTGGYTGASIHGIANGTLVLINGLRLAPFGRPTIVGPERSSVDLNTLPMADIERIEVLSDGASSLYGTDATAGVINIILRKERRGWEITADKTIPQGSRGQGYTSSLSWGTGDLRRDGYSFLITGELAHRQELLGVDREYASKGRYFFVQDGKTWQLDGLFQTINTSPATLRQRVSSTTSAKWTNSFPQDGNCSGTHLPFRDQKTACATNVYPDLGIYPEEDNKRIHARAQWAISDAVVFTDLIYGQHQSSIASRWWAPSFSAFDQPVGSPGYTAALAAGLDPANTRILWRPNLPALRERSDIDNLRISTGVKGVWQEWDYNASAYLAENKARWYDQIDGGLFYDSLGLGANQPWTRADVFQPLNASNPLRDELYALRGDYKLLNKGTTSLKGVEFRMSRAIGEIDGKDVLLGVGAEMRQEGVKYEKVSAELLNASPSFDVTRNIHAAYSELQIPITSTFDVNAALRSDTYSDVGTTRNGKLSTRWALTPQWAIRGSTGSGFRAPSPAQVIQTNEIFMVGQSSLPLACTPDQQQIAANLKTNPGVTGLCTSNSYPRVFGQGNPDLKPETSRQQSFGLSFVPHANLRWAFDVWRLQLNNTIRYLSEESILANPAKYAKNYVPMPSAYASLGFTPGDLSLLTMQENTGRSEKKGVDLEMQWRAPTDWGRLTLSAQGTYILRSTDQAESTAPVTSDLGQYSTATVTATPRLQSRIMAGLSEPEWTATLVLQYVSGYKDANVYATDTATGEYKEVQAPRVRSFTTLDAFTSWNVQPKVTVNLGVRNVFNQQAPQTFSQTSFQVLGASTRYANLWGRTIQLGFTARF